MPRLFCSMHRDDRHRRRLHHRNNQESEREGLLLAQHLAARQPPACTAITITLRHYNPQRYQRNSHDGKRGHRHRPCIPRLITSLLRWHRPPHRRPWMDFQQCHLHHQIKPFHDHSKLLEDHPQRRIVTDSYVAATAGDATEAVVVAAATAILVVVAAAVQATYCNGVWVIMISNVGRCWMKRTCVDWKNWRLPDCYFNIDDSIINILLPRPRLDHQPVMRERTTRKKRHTSWP